MQRGWLQRVWLGLGVVAIGCLESGCCTVVAGHKMEYMGVSRWVFRGAEAALDREGNLVVEGELTCEQPQRRSELRAGKPPRIRQRLGRRYMILRAEKLEPAVRAAIDIWHRKRAQGHLNVASNGTPVLSIGYGHSYWLSPAERPTDEAAARSAPGWFFWPGDVDTVIEQPALPSFVSADGLVHAPLSGVPYQFGGEAYTLSVLGVCGGTVGLREERAGWATPVRRLVHAPFLLIDIVTFPISVPGAVFAEIGEHGVE